MWKTKEQKQAYNKSWYQKKIDEGLCPRCGIRTPKLGGKLCQVCIDVTSENNRKRLESHRLAGLCMCGNPTIEKRKLCCKCQEASRKGSIKERANSKSAQSERKKIKEKVLLGYGGKCVCCGETRQWALQLDHVHNNGASHRKELGTRRSHMWRWALKNNFPDTLQLLCATCNFGKALYGECPHKTEAVSE